MWIFLLLISIFFVLLFSGLEYAFLASNRLTVDLKRKQNSSSAQIMAGFFEKPEKFWSTTIIGFYVALIAFGAFLLPAASPFFHFLSGALFDNDYIRLAILYIAGTLIIAFVIGIMSKRLFQTNPEDKLMAWAPFVSGLSLLMTPFTKFAVSFSEFVLKYLFNVRIKEKNSVFERVSTRDFMKYALEGHIDDESLNRELFDRALQFSQVKVRKCMVPRNEVVALEMSEGMDALKRLFISSKYSKVVIYQKNIDHIIGYVHHVSLNKRPKTMQEVLMPISTVPETMNAIDLINKFTKEHKSIALVVDEFGGTAGVISMENVLEEIFGNISEEENLHKEQIEQVLGPKEFIFSGRLKIDYLNEKYHLNIKARDAETLSGYIISRYESIPKQKNRIIIDHFEFDILAVNETRIEKVKMKNLN